MKMTINISMQMFGSRQYDDVDNGESMFILDGIFMIDICMEGLK